VLATVDVPVVAGREDLLPVVAPVTPEPGLHPVYVVYSDAGLTAAQVTFLP
jgi:hypothetical protein